MSNYLIKCYRYCAVYCRRSACSTACIAEACCSTIRGDAPAAARCAVERSDEYIHQYAPPRTMVTCYVFTVRYLFGKIKLLLRNDLLCVKRECGTLNSAHSLTRTMAPCRRTPHIEASPRCITSRTQHADQSLKTDRQKTERHEEEEEVAAEAARCVASLNSSTHMINEPMKPFDTGIDIGAVLRWFDGRHLLLNVSSSKQLTTTRTSIRRLSHKHRQPPDFLSSSAFHFTHV